MSLFVKAILGLVLAVALFALIAFLVKVVVAMAMVAAIALTALYLVNFVRAFARRLAARDAAVVPPTMLVR